MSKRQYQALAALCKIESGFPFKSSEWVEAGIPVVKIKNVQDGLVSLDGCAFVTQESAHKAHSFFAGGDDVLISLTGYVGQVGRIQLGHEVLVNQRVGVVRPKRQQDRDFIFYLLRYLRPQVESIATGSAQANVSPLDIMKMQVPVFSPEEQLTLSRCLRILDNKVRINQQIAATLEQIAQTIFKSWFVDFDPVHAKARGEQPVGMDAETAALFPDSFEDSEVGPIPSGWRLGRISDLGQVTTGKTPSTKVEDYWNGDVPFVTIPDLHKGSLVLDTARYLTQKGTESQKGQNIPSGSTMVSCIATAGLVGLAANSCQTNQQINSVIPTNFDSREWVFNCMLNLRPILKNESSIGTVFANLSKSGFSQIQITLPVERLMLAYSGLVRPLIELAIYREMEIKTLVALRDSLLPRLISGELELPAELLEV